MSDSGSDDEADSSGSDSDSEDSFESSDESEAPAPKKRKAEEVSTPAAKKSKTDGGLDDETKRNLFVGRLSWVIDDEWLRREFEKFGEIESANVIMDRQSGRSKGFVFLPLDTPMRPF